MTKLCLIKLVGIWWISLPINSIKLFLVTNTFVYTVSIIFFIISISITTIPIIYFVIHIIITIIIIIIIFLYQYM